MTAQRVFPRVRVEAADGFERGRMLGSEIGELIRGSIDVYQETFAHYTGLRWTEVRTRAAEFMDPIAAFDAEIAREIEGIAAGAGVEVEDILAINARSEIMFGLSVLPPPECTSFFVDPGGTRDGHTLLGQNWDWRTRTAATTVLVEIGQETRPAFLMLAEAGLVGKVGFNSSGVGVATNTLVSERDEGKPGVPMHVVLRGILNSPTFDDAREVALSAQRAGSANYLIAADGGKAVDIETGPGGRESAALLFPSDGVLVHSNNFRSAAAPADATSEIWLDSPVRADTLEAALKRGYGDLDVAAVTDLLADHTCFPNAICRHPDASQHPVEQTNTVASWILDLSASSAAVCIGPPCEGTYVEVTPEFRTRRP